MGLRALSFLWIVTVECVSRISAIVLQHHRWGCESCQASRVPTRDTAYLVVARRPFEPNVWNDSPVGRGRDPAASTASDYRVPAADFDTSTDRNAGLCLVRRFGRSFYSRPRPGH